MAKVSGPKYNYCKRQQMAPEDVSKMRMGFINAWMLCVICFVSLLSHWFYTCHEKRCCCFFTLYSLTSYQSCLAAIAEKPRERLTKTSKRPQTLLKMKSRVCARNWMTCDAEPDQRSKKPRTFCARHPLVGSTKVTRCKKIISDVNKKIHIGMQVSLWASS